MIEVKTPKTKRFDSREDDMRHKFYSLINQARAKYDENNFPYDKWVKLDFDNQIQPHDSDGLFNWYYKQYNQLSEYIKPNSSVFDIGMGAGYNMWYFKNYSNCEVSGLDIEYKKFTLIREIIGFEENVLYQKIEPFTPINLPKSYNAITALKTEFDYRSGKHIFSLKEWEYFIDDVSQHIYSGGYLIIRPNISYFREEVLKRSKFIQFKEPILLDEHIIILEKI